MTRHSYCFFPAFLLLFSLAHDAASETTSSQTGVTVGFESVEGKKVLDREGKEIALIEGEVKRPPQEIHELILNETPKPNYDRPVPEVVSGRIVLEGDERGVAGVSVTDGYMVTKTDDAGRYTLRHSPLAVFVYITRPPERDVVGSWYKPLAETVDFVLKPVGQSEDEFTFVHVSDSHVSTDPRCLRGLSCFVDEVNALDPRPRFVFNSGDLINLDKQLKSPPSLGHAYFRNYVGIMNHLAMPYYNVAGDHADSSYRLDAFPPGDPRRGKALYWEYLGPNLFSFEYGKVHFISIDYVYHRQKEISNRLISEHVQWLRRDMAARAPGTFVVTGSENTLVPLHPEFPDIARQNDVRLQLVGDDHIVAYNDRSVPFRIGGALSGTWWSGPCADLSPQGYMIYHVKGETLECFYKGLDQRVAITSPRYGAALTGEVVFRAHLVEPRPDETLECSVNGSAWMPMKETARPLYRRVYEATGNSAAMDDGLITFEVRAVPDRERRSRVFVVHNHDDPSPVDAEAALSFTVGEVWPSQKPPKAKVDLVFNGRVIGSLEANHRKAYCFAVGKGDLRRVNVLSFSFSNLEDGMVITHPLLKIGGKTVEDPRAEAVRKTRSGHWPEKTVATMGFTVGNGPNEHSFALAQDEFYFVIGPPE